MATQFGGTGQYLRRTASLPSASAWTLAGWFRVRSVRSSAWQYFIDLDDGTNYAVVGYTDGGLWDFGTSGGAGSMTGPTTNVWTFIACTLAGSGAGNFKVYHAAAGASFTTGSSAGASFTPTGMYIGNDFADEWCNVDIAHVRVWDAVLTQAELEQEMYAARPVRFANLHLWAPLWSPSDVVDYSGNGRGWTVGGTLATVDGPPIAWGVRPWVVPYAAAASGGTGTLTATLGAATLTGAATAPVQATLTGTLAATTLTSASAAAVNGTLTGTLTAATLTASGSAPLAVNGTLTATLAGATLSSTAGVAVSGALTRTLAAATVSSAGAAQVAGALTGTLAAVTLTGQGYRLVGATVGGVVTASGRYFSTSSTGPIVLAGFHTWADISDASGTYPPSAFDWTAYLDALVAKGANYTKLWMMESARDWGDASPMYFAPIPWARTGPGNAADGRPKFDLTKYDNTWFERLRGRAIEAGNRGVYVCVQLFQGWHIESKGLTYNPWTYHPFNAANNINSIDGDANADGKGLETRLTTSTTIYNLQKAYVDQVIAAVGDLDNVIYEISNEDHNDSWDWQVALMGYIRTVESGRSKQHLVGITVCWPTSNNAQLAASSADWVSYADTDTTPDATTSGPVSAYDTDHNPNLFTTGRAWVWKALTRGHGGLWLMDEWAGETYGNDTRNDATWNVQRANLGYALDYAARLDLANATAQGSLSSTGYCLAKTTGRYQLLAYQDTSGAFTVNLTSLGGTFSLEWLRPATGATQAGSNVTGGAVRTLTPPWAGEDAVALLELAGSNADLTATLSAATLTGSAVVAVTATATVTLTAATLTSAAAVAVQAAATAALSAATLTSTGAVATAASVTVTLAAATLTSAAVAPVTGAVAATLTAATLTASAAGLAGGSLVATLAGATLDATAAVTVQATSTIALGVATLTGAGTVAVAGALAATLAAATLDAAAGAVSGATLTATLAEATLDATAAVTVQAALTAALDAATLTAASVMAVGAVTEVTLGAATLAAGGSVAVVGAVGATLAGATLTCYGYLEEPADVTGALTATLQPATLTAAAMMVLVAVLGRVTGPGGSGTVSGPKSTGTTGG